MRNQNSKKIKKELFGRIYWGDTRTKVKPHKEYDRNKEKENWRKEFYDH